MANKASTAPETGATVETAETTAAADVREAPAQVTPPEAETLPTPEAAQTPAALAWYTEQPAQVAAGRGLNLRSGPAPSFGVVAVLPDGAAVTVLALPYEAEVPGWELVRCCGMVGWVDGHFLAPAEA